MSTFSTDYLLFDGLEPFTLQQKGMADPQTVNNCLRQELNSDDLEFLETLGASEDALAVYIWDNELSGNVPAEGDSLTDANNVSYRIVNKKYRTLIGRHRCLCQLFRVN